MRLISQRTEWARVPLKSQFEFSPQCPINRLFHPFRSILIKILSKFCIWVLQLFARLAAMSF